MVEGILVHKMAAKVHKVAVKVCEMAVKVREVLVCGGCAEEIF